MKVWLLKTNKLKGQLQNPPEAVYALLMQGTDWLKRQYNY
jgi:hypothetical protein